MQNERLRRPEHPRGQVFRRDSWTGRGPLRYAAGQEADLSGSADIPLLGREAELTRLVEVLSRAKAGRGVSAWIEGEAGIGKSRLLSEALDRATFDGFAVFTGAAHELESSRPFGAVFDALSIGPASTEEHRRAIHRLITSASGRAGEASAPDAAVDLGYQVIESILTLIEDAASQEPVLLGLEDLHWADPSTIRALYSIIRRVTHLPIAVVGTFRPVPRPVELDALLRATEGDLHMVLQPLGIEDVARLTEQIVDAPPAKSLLEQVGEAAGNPLFVIELVRALRDEGAVKIASGVAEAHSAPRPPSLRLTILRRVNFLPKDTLEVLRVASILGSSFSLAHLSTVSGRTSAELLTPIAEAVRSGILIDAGESLRFRHDLIREAIYDDLPSAVRAGLHHEAARALDAAGTPALQVAEHIALGAAAGDREAAERLRDIAGASISVAPAVAARLLGRAVQLLEPSDPLRNEVAAALVMPLYLTGRVDEADRLARDILAAGATPPAIQYLVRRSLAYSLIIRGDVAKAVEEYRLVVMTTAPARGESAETNHAVDVTNLATALLNSGETTEARQRAEEAFALAQPIGSRFATALSLLAMAGVADAEGRVRDAVDLARDAMQIAEHSPSTANYWAHWVFGLTLAGADRVEEAESTIRTGLRLVEEQGRLSQLALYQLLMQLVLMRAGRWDDSLAAFEAISAVPERVASAINLILGRAMAAYIAVHRGSLDTAAGLVRDAERDAARTDVRLGLDFLASCRALLLESQGKVHEALTVATDAWDRCASTRLSSVSNWRICAPVIVRLSLEAGDLGRARAVTEEAEDAARLADGIVTAEATALRCRGMLERNPEMLLRAVELFRRSPFPIDRALATEDAAIALASTGSMTEARALFDEALKLYEAVGAARDIARATAALRRFGIRRGSRRPRARPASGWESLTPTEQQVVRHVAAGLPNAEIARQMFISRYTVETHLKHVYAKLGFMSRTELTAEAVRRKTLQI